jgi:hypothetical protein
MVKARSKFEIAFRTYRSLQRRPNKDRRIGWAQGVIVQSEKPSSKELSDSAGAGRKSRRFEGSLPLHYSAHPAF